MLRIHNGRTTRRANIIKFFFSPTEFRASISFGVDEIVRWLNEKFYGTMTVIIPMFVCAPFPHLSVFWYRDSGKSSVVVLTPILRMLMSNNDLFQPKKMTNFLSNCFAISKTETWWNNKRDFLQSVFHNWIKIEMK